MSYHLTWHDYPDYGDWPSGNLFQFWVLRQTYCTRSCRLTGKSQIAGYITAILLRKFKLSSRCDFLWGGFRLQKKRFYELKLIKAFDRDICTLPDITHRVNYQGLVDEVTASDLSHNICLDKTSKLSTTLAPLMPTKPPPSWSRSSWFPLNKVLALT